MAPKKKKESSKKSDAPSTKENAEPKPILLQEDREKWVILDFRLLNWKFMNFTMKFTEDTHIFTVKKVLAKRHGRMTDLKLCMNSFTESNELNDEMLKLADYGMRGQPLTIITDDNGAREDLDALPVFQIFYDFKPCDFGDPVLLYFAS